MDQNLIEKINSPADLRAIPDKQIPAICTEIREFLVKNVPKTGGHLASNLGATEMTVAIHRVFDSPKDHIIFDVGHQSYVHKMLTGRRERFDTLRTTGGMSGFTKMSESEHDAFGAGHSSTSVSAALGFAEADRLAGSDAYTVAVVGDGAYTGGMVHEALNNCDPDLRLIIILNENGMSISMNKGSFARYLSGVRISKNYLRWKKGTKSLLEKVPLLGKPINKLLKATKNLFKRAFFSSNYFEDLGLYYMGPIDGNDYKKLEKALKKAKSLKQSVIVHIKTVKGKGYEPAEQSPDNFHSVYSNGELPKSFHTVFADRLIDIASKDKDVVAITAAMSIGTGLDKFEEAFPDRCFDVGIAEGHAVTFAAGLAANGMKPFTAIYSTFLQRGYDSVLHDVALQSLPVKMMIDRAGLAVGDGATHHGIFDVAFLSHIPGVEILSPATYSALESAIDYAHASNMPVAVRYPNSTECERIVREFYTDNGTAKVGAKANFACYDAPECVYITYGTLVKRVLEATDIITKQTDDKVGVVLLEMLKPYDKVAEEILPYLSRAKRIVFAEEGIKYGGAAMLLRDALEAKNFDFNKCEYIISAIDDNFASPDAKCDLYDCVGLSANKLAEKMINGR